MRRDPTERSRILWLWSRRHDHTITRRSERRLFHIGVELRIPLSALAFAQRELNDLKSGFFELAIYFTPTQLIVEGTIASVATKRAVLDVLKEAVGKGSHPIMEIVDQLEVTAPFRPAHDSDLERYEIRGQLGAVGDGAEASNPSFVQPSDAKVDIDRFPAITSETSPVVREIFRFEVALNATPDDSATEPISFKEVPGDWQVLNVEVEVHSSRLLFKNGENRKTIEVLRRGVTKPASFSAMVLHAGEVSSLEIVAMFTYAGRFSGIARQTFEVKPANDVDRRASATSGPIAGVSLVSSEPADLTVKIIRLDSSGKYLWSLTALKGRDMGTPSREAIMNLGPSTGDWALACLKECPGFPAGRHASKLRGIGETIWAASPEPFRALYRDLRNAFGPSFPIQIVTDEPHIPWEMMHPDSSSGVDQPDHLFMTHPIARWFVQTDGRMPPVFEPGSIASFVPRYANDESLAMA